MPLTLGQRVYFSNRKCKAQNRQDALDGFYAQFGRDPTNEEFMRLIRAADEKTKQPLRERAASARLAKQVKAKTRGVK